MGGEREEFGGDGGPFRFEVVGFGGGGENGLEEAGCVVEWGFFAFFLWEFHGWVVETDYREEREREE